MRNEIDRHNNQMENSKDNFAAKGMESARDAVETVKEKAQTLTGDGQPVEAGQHEEGSITKRIENLTTRVSSGTFLSLAAGSVVLSAVLQGMGQKRNAQFVGQWVPTILILGLYNKLVKLQGSE